jgi:glycosyltransferase involved in cell wall biosynthesis
MKPKISLIVATLGRKQELFDLLKSLKRQTFNNFEVIIVDQNEPSYLDDIILPYLQVLNLIHIRSSVKGLSYNRNVGLSLAKGEMLAFPDDDCQYEPTLLENVINLLVEPGSFITCNSRLNPASYSHYFSKSDSKITKYNVLDKAISFTIFIKYRKKSDILFDDFLGSGAYFGAGEETDLLLSLLSKKYKAFYFSNLFVYHPELASHDINKVCSYSRGFGALYFKESFIRYGLFYFLKFHIDLFLRLIFILIPFSNFLIIKDKYIIKSIFINRIKGFYTYSFYARSK